MSTKDWAEYRYLSVRAREVFKALRKEGVSVEDAMKKAMQS